MKSKLTDEKICTSLPYPKLMITKTSGCIVLFHEEEKGVCLQKGDTQNIVGNHSSIWNMHAFEDFTGSITLSND